LIKSAIIDTHSDNGVKLSYEIGGNTYEWTLTSTINGGDIRYTNLADATADKDALNRQTGDARYAGIAYEDHGALGGLGDDDHSQYALLAGRDGESLAIDEVKAYDGAGLKLYEDSGEGIFVKDGGNVGIGTDTPSHALQVIDDSAAIGTYNKIVSFYSTGMVNGDTSQFMWGKANSLRNQAEFNFYYAGNNSLSNELRFGLFGKAGILVLDGNGNVGVGTTPSSAFHVDASSSIVKLYDSAMVAGGKSVLRIGKDDAVNETFSIEYKQHATKSLVSFHFYGNTFGDSLVLEYGGNVGIKETSPTSTLDVDGSLSLAIETITAAATLDITHYTVLCDATAAAFTVTLPAASGATGRIYNIKKIDSIIGIQYTNIKIQCDGSNWYIL